MIDTNIAIYACEGNDIVLGHLANHGAEVVLSVLSLVELQRGLMLARTTPALRSARLDLLLESVSILPFTESAVRAYRHVIAQCGWTRSRDFDRMIAAHAMCTACVLVTNHQADFRDVPVAVVLSAQATDLSVNKATKTLFAEAPDPAAMVKLGVDGVGHHIRSIGLWQGKAKNVVALSQILLDAHAGRVPNNRDALEALPGVGRKTANVVLNVAFGEATMAVDTHIFRLGNRTGLAPGETPREVEDGLVKRIPKALLRPAHHWLILHGRYTCRARKPDCFRCVAYEWCRFKQKTAFRSAPAEE
jgi:endonuclease-3